MALERSIAARSARSKFFEEVNDIDIFVEDTALGYEKLLSTIFSRKFTGQFRVDKVFPLGSRKEVIKNFQENIESITRPTLYVVDGDLFILTGDTIENKNGFYKFPFYCFENLLCEKNAIIDILDEEEIILFKDELIEKFDFDNWERNNLNLLFDLFIVYAVSMKLKPTVQTVAYEVKNLVQDGFGNLSKEKVEARIESINHDLKTEFGTEVFNSTRDIILTRFAESGCSKLDVVSGKDYIFPLLKVKSRSTVKTSMSDLNFKMRLAMKTPLDRIAECRNSVAIPSNV
ncbi:DUF4435 domain-containing protein [Vibrio sp. 10N.261.52.C2]|uniref:DUF4435 domain-containing protein n=1 Tax=unclassified Vibrio TaxID=2614977 RepID=UPI00352DF63A